MSWTGWAAMGGYAAFVWPAYGVALAVLGGMALQSWRRYRASIRDLDMLQGRLQGSFGRR
jgi:heme exporter protein D